MNFRIVLLILAAVLLIIAGVVTYVLVYPASITGTYQTAAGQNTSISLRDLMKPKDSEMIVHFTNLVPDIGAENERTVRVLKDSVKAQAKRQIRRLLSNYQIPNWVQTIVVLSNYYSWSNRFAFDAEDECPCGEKMASIHVRLPMILHKIPPAAAGSVIASQNGVQDLYQSAVDIVDPPADVNPNVDLSTIGSPGNAQTIKIAIVDSGVDLTDPIIQQYLYKPAVDACSDVDDIIGYDFVSDDQYAHDISNHGENVAKEILEELGVYASPPQNPNIRLIPIRAFNGSGNSTAFQAYCATMYAKQIGADIINCSWGLFTPQAGIGSMHSSMSNVASNTTAVVCAIGNEDSTITNINHFPSGFMWDMNVGGNPLNRIPNLYEVTGYTSTGATHFSNRYSNQDPPQRQNYNLEGCPVIGGAPMCGTSYSAATLTARIAKYLLANPGANSVNVWNCLISETAPFGQDYVDVDALNPQCY